MAKNVFVTTLSTLRSVMSESYYVYQEKGQSLFCNGFCTNEAGAKAVLHSQIINRIVIIGSKETYQEKYVNGSEPLNGKTLRDCADILRKDEDLKAPYKKEQALAFFTKRMVQYLQGIDTNGDETFRGIDEARKAELQQLVRDFCQQNMGGNHKGDNWFELLYQNGCQRKKDSKTENLVKLLKEKIEENIRKEYLKASEYEKYKSFAEKLKERKAELEVSPAAMLSIRALDELEKLKKAQLDKASLQYEAFCAVAIGIIQVRIDEVKQRLHDNILKSIPIDEYLDTITNLQSAVERLTLELKDTKSHRLDLEQKYALHYLYEQLKPDHKLCGKKENLDVMMVFVPLTLENDGYVVRNIEGIVKAIRSTADAEEDCIKLYIDVQGGNRTDDFERNAIFSILNNETNSKITIRQVFGTIFEQQNFANEIVDVTDRYRITELVAGMNAFIQYGKAGQLVKYVKELGKTESISETTKNLVQTMKKIDESLGICDTKGLYDAINEMRKLLNTSEESEAKSTGDATLQILTDGIRRDYGKILEGDRIDLLAVLRWATQKNMVQQALTLIEAKIPEAIYADKIYYPTENYAKEVQNTCKSGGPEFEELKFQPYQLKTADARTFFIRYYAMAEAKKEKTEAAMVRMNALDGVNVFSNAKCSWQDLQKLFKNYDEIVTMRNNINHASNGQNREKTKELMDKINTFINDYLTIRGTVGPEHNPELNFKKKNKPAHRNNGRK